MVSVRDVAPEQVRPLLRVEYERLIELGAFDHERVELLDGTLVTMSPQGAKHAECLRRLTRLLVVALADRATVQIQTPLAAGDRSLPEPDVAVLPLGSYPDSHPEAAIWVIEVADSSRARDRAKANVYAGTDIDEYWIFNLEDRVVEVHRRPSGGRYLDVVTHDATSALAPNAFPDLIVQVAEVLP